MKGNKIVPVRFDPELLAEITRHCERSLTDPSYAAVYDVSGWIRKACREKLDHLKRGKRTPRPATPTTPETV